jgi:hypothetical protein
MGFQLSRSPFHEFLFHNGVSTITEPLFTNFSFTVESWLSRSPFHEFYFHSGVSAITIPFHEFFFSRWNSGYQGAFHMNFCFSRWDSGYQGAFHTNFSFSRWNSQNARFGGRLFSYIYHKEYLHRIRLIKNLAS